MGCLMTPFQRLQLQLVFYSFRSKTQFYLLNQHMLHFAQTIIYAAPVHLGPYAVRTPINFWIVSVSSAPVCSSLINFWVCFSGHIYKSFSKFCLHFFSIYICIDVDVVCRIAFVYVFFYFYRTRINSFFHIPSFHRFSICFTNLINRQTNKKVNKMTQTTNNNGLTQSINICIGGRRNYYLWINKRIEFM